MNLSSSDLPLSQRLKLFTLSILACSQGALLWVLAYTAYTAYTTFMHHARVETLRAALFDSFAFLVMAGTMKIIV
eukprot:6484468-Amphidinium_carterae.3